MVSFPSKSSFCALARSTKQYYHIASVKKNLPKTVEELVFTIKTLRNKHCVVTYQRNGTALIFNILVDSLNCYVIISASQKLGEATLTEYKKLHQLLELEFRSFGVVLHYYPNIKRIFKARRIKRRTIGEIREAKRRRQQEEVVNHG